MNHRAPEPGKVANAVAAVGALIAALTNILPASWGAWVRKSRKAIIAAAGATLSVVAALDMTALPNNYVPWVALASAAATAIVTYWVPNEQADG